MACNPSSPEVKAEKSEVQGHPRPIQKIPGQFGIQETLFKKVVWGSGGEGKRMFSSQSMRRTGQHRRSPQTTEERLLPAQ